jgi:plastocyanin
LSRTRHWVTASVMLLMITGYALAPTVTAQEDAESEVTLNVITDDDLEAQEYWFEIEGLDGRNPDLELTPGVTYTVNMENVGDEPHNLRFPEPIDVATEIIGPGESDSITFTVPEDAEGEDEYWCDVHLVLGHVGTLRFTAAEDPSPPEDPEPAPPEPEEVTPDDPGVPGWVWGLVALVVLAAIILAVAMRRGRT